MSSHFDRFNRLHVSREDSARLSREWNQQHGTPMNSGEVIAREQWVAKQVAADIKSAGS